MRREKLYKNYIKKSLLTGSDGFPILNISNLHDSATSQRNKNVWKTFLFWYMDFIHTACLTRSTPHLSKILSFSQVEIYVK
jgi:hypothetical protein